MRGELYGFSGVSDPQKTQTKVLNSCGIQIPGRGIQSYDGIVVELELAWVRA